MSEAVTPQGQGGEYDLIVLGGGTGGYATALRARGLGMTVALIERDVIGGTCLHRGCIPSKAMLHAAEIAEALEEGNERWGVRSTREPLDMKALAASRDDIVQKNYKGLVDHLRHDGVELFAGDGYVTSSRSVRVSPLSGSQEAPVELRARRSLVIATGSRPRGLPGISFDGERVVTSDHATHLEDLPDSVVIVGAGAIGMEFATFFHALGCKTTVVEALDRVLPTEDPDVSREMARALRRKHIDALTGARVDGVEDSGDHLVVHVTKADGQPQAIETAKVLIAVGREPVTEGIGLDEIGVARDRGYLVPSRWETLETSVPGVYAVGDLLPPPSLALAHASFLEGMLVAEASAGMRTLPIDYHGVPRATYSLPQAASVGLSEPEAKEAGYDVVVNKMPFTATAKGLIYGQGGMVKVVADKSGLVLGVHMVGPLVTEMISEGMLITDWEALASEVAEHIHPHPSLSEAIGENFLTLAGRRLHQQG
jgi:dihydrolipoamide dehydrogenase